MLRVFGWVTLGFLAGVAATVAAMTVTPREMQSEATPSGPEKGAAGIAPEDGDPLIGADPLGEVGVEARVAMIHWMTAHPQYEFITRDYCHCAEISEPVCPEPGFESRRGDYPYTESYDYNGDGHKDFAIMLALKGEEGPHVLLIFNGPFGNVVPTPAFSQKGWQRNDNLRGGFVGPPESDNGYNIKAKGATYELVYMGDSL